MVTSSVLSERSQAASARLSEPAQPAYTPPEVVEVGPSGRLVNGEGGKHHDGFSGWYWNGEG